MNSWSSSAYPTGGSSVAHRGNRVVDSHGVSISPCTRTWFASRARGHGQPGGFSCGKLLRLEAHRRRLRRRRLVGRGRVGILSENLRTAGGEPPATSACRRAGTRLRRQAPRPSKPGIRFDEDGELTADLADGILDELIAIDAGIIYIGMHPDDQRFSTSGSSRRK